MMMFITIISLILEMVGSIIQVSAPSATSNFFGWIVIFSHHLFLLAGGLLSGGLLFFLILISSEIFKNKKDIKVPANYLNINSTGNKGIINNGQSGDIHINNVTFINKKPRGRIITIEQTQKFSDIASLPADLTCNVQVRIAENSDTEAAAFGKQLLIMLNNAKGWKAFNFGNSSGVFEPFTGIIINIADPSNPTGPENHIIEGFRALSISFTIEKWENIMPRILIGAKP